MSMFAPNNYLFEEANVHVHVDVKCSKTTEYDVIDHHGKIAENLPFLWLNHYSYMYNGHG